MADQDPIGEVTMSDIAAAADRIASLVHRTPLIECDMLSESLGCRLWFKCENLQKGGAFKARGAHNAVFLLDADQAARGVITHSSGNHGAALALAARARGVSARVVVPATAPAVKKAAMARYGAAIVECEPTLEARETTVAAIQADTGAVLVHPYDDPAVIAGQGTVGLELSLQLDERPDVVLVPVGGGGLLAGVAVAVTSLWPGTEVIGVEPAGADDAFRSFHSGRWQPQTGPATIADGLLTSLGHRNFRLIRRLVDDLVTVTDEQIVEAMRLLWTGAKLVAEPSGAVALAAVLADRERFAGRSAVAVVSGGNVDLDRLPWCRSGDGSADRDQDVTTGSGPT
jgi:threonine dehydratase